MIHSLHHFTRLTCLAICCLLIAPVKASSPHEFDSATVAELFQWAARLTGRQIDSSLQPPPIHPTPAAQLKALMCPDQPTRCARVAAAYSIEAREIIYRDALSSRQTLDRSILVHELVHFLQHQDQGEKANASCRRILANEREAYAAQAIYLRIHDNFHPVGTELRLIRCPPEPVATRKPKERPMSDSHSGI